MYDLSCDFNMELHKKTYIHYLEVVIDPDGVIHYAVPSHQEYLIAECMKKMNWSRQELSDACPEEYYGDFVTWLCKISGCISVWENFIQFWEINDVQFITLKELQKEDLYLGNMPERSMSIEEYREIIRTEWEKKE